MKTVFFDLDGTLIDSKKDIADSINFSLLHFKVEPIEDSIIYECVGNGIDEFVKLCLRQRNREDLQGIFSEYFTKHYRKHFLDHTILFDGIDNVLKQLSKRTDMFVVSNKHKEYSAEILKGLNVFEYFIDVVGGNSFENRKPHPEPILKLAEKYNLNLKDSLFIGDSETDILASHAAGVKIAWASYGFRTDAILSRYSVDFVVNSPEEIMNII